LYGAIGKLNSPTAISERDLVVFTKHEEEGAFVVEKILRNLPPVKPFVVEWQYPLFVREGSLDFAQEGLALAQIRDRRLHKFDFNSFEAGSNGSTTGATLINGSLRLSCLDSSAQIALSGNQRTRINSAIWLALSQSRTRRRRSAPRKRLQAAKPLRKW
jgi:hypothetical protein